jgi:hypothetical protein
VLIEFIGAAGVGKRNFDLIEIKKSVPRNLILAPQATWLGMMTRPKTPSHLARAVSVIAKYSIRRNICLQSGGIHITSEGLFHRIITLHRNSRSIGMVQLADMLFGKIEPPDVVVLVEASAEKVFARRSDRNRPNDLFSVDSVKADITIVKECIGAMVYVQRTVHPSMRILQVTADEEGGEAAIEKIVAALEVSLCDSQMAARPSRSGLS